MVFVDTWAWIALAVGGSEQHALAKRQQDEFVAAGRVYVTTDYVLSELITQLYRVSSASTAERFIGALLAAIENGTYRLENISSQRFASAWELCRRYIDKPKISFVDFTSFVTMRELAIQDVFTGDAHFAN